MACSLRTVGIWVSITVIWLGVLAFAVTLTLQGLSTLVKYIIIAICIHFSIAALVMFLGITRNHANYLCPMLFMCYFMGAVWICFVFYCSNFHAIFISTPFALICFLLIYLTYQLHTEMVNGQY